VMRGSFFHNGPGWGSATSSLPANPGLWCRNDAAKSSASQPSLPDWPTITTLYFDEFATFYHLS
jgi:hypothetical protein